MSESWIAYFYVWPYSGVPRGEAKYLDEHERKTRGARDFSLPIEAHGFKAAYERAQDILRGIMLDERVWNAGIVGVIQTRIIDYDRAKAKDNCIALVRATARDNWNAAIEAVCAIPVPDDVLSIPAGADALLAVLHDRIHALRKSEDRPAEQDAAEVAANG